MNLKLYVGNLAFSTEEGAIQDLFAEAGPVQSVSLVRDRATGQSRGFAFVEMETEEGAFGGNGGGSGRPRNGGGGGGFNRRREPRW